MPKKRLQNIIAESRWALQVLVPIILAIWVLVAYFERSAIVSLACLLASAFLIIELNNRNSLIRIYSRMIPCSFLILVTMSIFLFIDIRTAVVTLCLAGFYNAIFRCYQDEHSQGWVFYAFLCLGIASTFCIRILFFVPLVWILLRTNLLVMNVKIFVSSILGIIFPYWFLILYFAAIGKSERILQHVVQLAQFDVPAQLNILSGQQMLMLVYLFVCALTGTVHFIRQKCNDSIRTRLLYKFFMTIDFAAFAFAILQPRHYCILLSVMTVSTTPLIAHFFVFTHTRVTNMAFKLFILGAVALTAYNLWTFLPISF